MKLFLVTGIKGDVIFLGFRFTWMGDGPEIPLIRFGGIRSTFLKAGDIFLTK